MPGQVVGVRAVGYTQSKRRFPAFIEGLTIPAPFSTSEFDTGQKWIDGRTIFGKVLPFATGPTDGAPTQIPHGLGPNEGFTIVTWGGCLHTPDGFVQFPLPYINYVSNLFSVQFELIADLVVLQTGAGGGQYDEYEGHVVLEFVKNP